MLLQLLSWWILFAWFLFWFCLSVNHSCDMQKFPLFFETAVFLHFCILHLHPFAIHIGCSVSLVTVSQRWRDDLWYQIVYWCRCGAFLPQKDAVFYVLTFPHLFTHWHCQCLCSSFEVHELPYVLNWQSWINNFCFYVLYKKFSFLWGKVCWWHSSFMLHFLQDCVAQRFYGLLSMTNSCRWLGDETCSPMSWLSILKTCRGVSKCQ